MRDKAKAPIDASDPFRKENFFLYHVRYTLICYPNHSRDEGSALPKTREIHKNGIEAWYPYAKDGFLVP
jgi:hypothetical protein